AVLCDLEMLRSARMAAMTGGTAACWFGGEGQVWAVSTKAGGPSATSSAATVNIAQRELLSMQDLRRNPIGIQDIGASNGTICAFRPRSVGDEPPWC
ncbi:MAG: hypothetical protein WBN04_13840, partial [Paracoccaceae bacterium]